MNVVMRMEGVSKAVSTLLDLVCATAVEDIYLETMSNHVTVRTHKHTYTTAKSTDNRQDGY